MSTVQRQVTDVRVDLAARSVTYITNTMFQALLRIVGARGLDPTSIADGRAAIERGLFVWFAERTLTSAHLEVFVPDRDGALERWVFKFTYSDTGHGEARQPPVAELAELCSKLRSLPEGARYRIVARTLPSASRVPGWTPTRLRPLRESRSEELRAWGYGNISASLRYVAGE